VSKKRTFVIQESAPETQNTPKAQTEFHDINNNDLASNECKPRPQENTGPNNVTEDKTLALAEEQKSRRRERADSYVIVDSAQIHPIPAKQEIPRTTENEVEQIHVPRKMTSQDFNELKTIGLLGTGAFGKVTVVETPGPNKMRYACKAVWKKSIAHGGEEKHILNEKLYMGKMKHDFIIGLVATYQDKHKVYFITEYAPGGELFTLRRNSPGEWSEKSVRYYAGCIIDAFGYMHEKDIIYRDLKPENIVLDKNGKPKITDFGFAKEVPQDEDTFTLCGTTDYVAPEIILNQGHGKGVDWWALGILLYELYTNHAPFVDDEPIETYRKILKGKVKYPTSMSNELKDLIGGFLRINPKKRYGVKHDITWIKNHPFFTKDDGFSFSDLSDMTPPYKPKEKTDETLNSELSQHKDKHEALWGDFDGCDPVPSF